MRTQTRLALFGAGLVTTFGAAFAVAGLVVPDDAAADWAEQAGSPAAHDDETAAHDDETAAHDAVAASGTSLEQDGYVLGAVSAPAAAGVDGEISFVVLAPDGAPLTSYTRSHDKDLHLVVVRSDGALFSHVHPAMAPDGTWSLPWVWQQPGTYRVFADLVPAGRPAADASDEAPGITLTRTVEVARNAQDDDDGTASSDVVTTAPSDVVTTATVDGYDVTLSGDLTAGEGSELVATVTRDGAPVTDLEPYLGAFGHLVALRQGDLAYLHVHPEGEEPAAGQTSGPEIVFTAHAPTAGLYLLYLDVQIDGEVRTTSFVLDAGPAGPTEPAGSTGSTEPADDPHGSTTDEDH